MKSNFSIPNRLATALMLWLAIATALSGCGQGQSPEPQTAGTDTPPQAKAQADVTAGTPFPRTLQDPPAAAEPAESARQAQTPPAPNDSYEGYTLVDEPRIVAAGLVRVNDRTIGVHDVLAPLRDKLRVLGRSGDEKAFRAAVQRLVVPEMRRQIGQALVLDEARRRLIEAETKYIDQQVQDHLRDMIAEAGGSQSKLQAQLTAEGSSLSEMTDVLTRQITVRYYLQKTLLPQMGFTRRELARYYHKHIEDFTQPKTVQMQIFALPLAQFNPASSARAEARRIATEALGRIRAGEDFGKVVRELSRGGGVYRAAQGGVWDAMPVGSFREEKVEAAALAQAPGDVSDIIEGETGLFIVKTLEIHPGAVTPFGEAQEDIERKLRTQQYDRLTAEHFRRLSAKATIVEAPDARQLVLQQAVQLYWQGSRK